MDGGILDNSEYVALRRILSTAGAWALDQHWWFLTRRLAPVDLVAGAPATNTGSRRARIMQSDAILD